MLSKTKTQSLQAAIIHILAAAIGSLSTLFLYPKDLELYGIYGFLTNTASLLVPFVSLGFGNVMLRFFPYYKDPGNHHKGFFGFILTAYGMGILIFSFMFCFFYKFILDSFHSDNKLAEVYFLILPFTILLVCYEFASQLCINFQKINWTAWTALLLKIFLPLLFILSIKNFIAYKSFITLIFLYYAVVVCWIMIRISKKESFLVQFSKDLYQQTERNKLLQYAGFSLLSGTSAVLALRLDSFFVGSMMGAEATGLFTLAMFMSNVVFIPATAITDALNPSIAHYSKENDQTALLKYYQSGSIHMMMATFFLVIMLMISFDTLSNIMPNAAKINAIKTAVYFLLFSRAIDAATGTNHHILSYSKYYKYELYLLIGMAILNISLNYYLIPKWGITGAAFATFVSVGLYNLCKTLLVYFLLNMHPFTIQSLKVLGIASVTFVIFNGAFELENPYMSLFLQMITSGFSFLLLTFIFKCSPDLNKFVAEKFIKRFDD
ncbi:MAG: polysaccharide biosynthesis C-terminal domain-containing protein [Saprospiraceae bacterium]|nr:polysaccharide biosynthesis C-terminal domain-containing protein [Saprospiraceae bacterium]